MDRLVRDPRGDRLPDDLGEGQDSARFDLKAALAFTRRRWRTILFTALGVLVLIVLGASQLERRYTASALLVVDSRASQLVGFDSAPDPVSAGFAIDAEVAIARSPPVVERVVRLLELWKAPGFAPRPSLTDRFLVLVGLADPTADDVPDSWQAFSQKQRLGVLESVERALDIQRRPLTSLIDVSATAKSPELAASIANALADSYLAVQTDEKVQSTQRAVDFLRERVDELAAEIDAIEAELETFVTTKLAELGSAEARAMLLALERNGESRANLVRTLSDLQAALDEQNYERAVDLVGGTVADYARRRAALLAQLEDATLDPSAIRRIQDELSRIEDEIRAAAASRASLLRTEIADADRANADLRARLETELSQQDVPREVGTELFRLQRDAEIQRNLYSSYLTKLRQVEQQSVFDLPDSRIASPAVPPRSASYPPFAAIGLGGLFVSLLAGFGVALLREYYVGGATTAEQLEAVTGFPSSRRCRCSGPARVLIPTRTSR
jgi:succinoglycan biosynthesis transport protein ExoP